MDIRPNANIGQTNSAKRLSPINVLSLSFGCIIGWGSFMMPGTTFLPVAGVFGTLITIVIGAVFFVIIAKTYAYMVEKFPNNGGSFGIVSQVLDKPHAFLTVWSLIFAYISLLWVNAINFAPLTRCIFGNILQWGFDYSVGGYHIYFGEALTELFAIVCFGFIVAYGKRIVVILQTFFFLFLLTTVTMLFVGILISTDLSILIHPAFADNKPIPLQIYNILLFVPWMFVGFGTVSFLSKDYSFPIKKINCIMPLAIVLGALDYAMLNTIAATAVPKGFETNAEYLASLNQLSGIEQNPVVYAVTSKLGNIGKTCLGIAMFCALSSSLIGFYMALGNMLKSLSDAQLLPKRYGDVSSDGIPRRAIFFVMLISIVMPFIGKNVTTWLTDATSISVTIAYAYISYCCIRVASKNGDRKILAIVSFIVSLCLFLFPLMTSMFFENIFNTESYFILAIWGIIGYAITAFLSEGAKN